MKLLMRIFLVATIVAGGGAIFLGFQIKKTKEELDGTVKTKEAENTKLQGDLKKAATAEEDAKKNLTVATERLKSAQTEAENVKKQASTLETKVKEVEGKLTDTTKQLQENQTKVDEIKKALPPDIKVEDIVPTIKGYEEKFAALDTEKKVLEQHMRKMDDDNKKMKEKITVAEKAEAPGGMMGHVVSVNKEWNFVVVDIGSAQGAKEGSSMLVYRDTQLIGKVRIASVDPSVSIADIIPEWTQQEIQEGDLVSN